METVPSSVVSKKSNGEYVQWDEYWESIKDRYMEDECGVYLEGDEVGNTEARICPDGKKLSEERSDQRKSENVIVYDTEYFNNWLSDN